MLIKCRRYPFRYGIGTIIQFNPRNRDLCKILGEIKTLKQHYSPSGYLNLLLAFLTVKIKELEVSSGKRG